jgi:transposase
MGDAYQKAIRENLPEAAMAFGHFHAVMMMNERIDQLRRGACREARERERKVICGSWYLLLKNQENLSGKNNEKEGPDRPLALNTPLTRAYVMKEDLRQVWWRESCEACLEYWIGQA